MYPSAPDAAPRSPVVGTSSPLVRASPLVSARDLHVHYPETHVLHDISVDLAPGTFAAVTGPNGSGKSTLVETLAGVRTPTSGRVDRTGTVAFVAQNPEAPAGLPLTALDAVRIGTRRGPFGLRASARGESARRGSARRGSGTAAALEALARVGMDALARRPITALSGGQRQRVFLAQGLVQEADLLVLDEAGTGLDADSRATVRSLLGEEAHARGAAVLLVTHDEEDVRAADAVWRLDGGRLVA